MTWIIPLIAGFTLGCLHAFDVDHLTAVTAFASTNPSGTGAARFGIFWGLGHTATVFVLGLATVLFKFVIPPAVESFAELLVGLLLMLIGIWTIKEVLQQRHIHAHKHAHDGVEHIHFHSHKENDQHNHHHSMFAVGATHGLAGTASVMVIVPMAIVQSAWRAAAYLLLFGLGTIVSMTTFAYTLGRLTTRLGSRNLLVWFRGTAGAVSLGVGITWIVERML